MYKSKLHKKTCLSLFILLFAGCSHNELQFSRSCSYSEIPLIKYGKISYFKINLDIPTCNVPVNQYSLIFDTGSSFTLIEKSLCNSGEIPKQFLGIKTLSGSSQHNFAFTSASYSIEKNLQEKVDIHLADIKSKLNIDGIAGANFFQNKILVIDFPYKFYIVNEVACLNTTMYPFTNVSGQIHLPVAMKENQDIDFILDTGASLSFISRFDKTSCNEKESTKDYFDFTGKTMKGRVCEIAEICAAGVCLEPLDFIVPEKAEAELVGILGSNFFSKYYVIIDYKNHKTGFQKKDG